MRSVRAVAALAALVPALVGSDGAFAEATLTGSEPVFAAAQATAQLDQAVAALSGAAPQADPTEELRDLALALPSLSPAERRRARRVLARPPAGEQDTADLALGATWTPTATLTRRCVDSPGGRFRVHYVTSAHGGDQPPSEDVAPLNGIPDYVEMVAARADTSWDVQNEGLGWPAPKSDGSKGNNGPGCSAGGTDIYLADLANPDVGVLYGYAAPDDTSSSCNRPPFKCSAYLVLDNDYAEPEYGYEGEPDVPLSVTTAHEYNHILQFNLDSNQDAWMLESTAVWAEEKTFPDADDWIVAFMDRWARDAEIPITKPTPRRIYGTAVWNHWLELGAGYGPDVILDAWEGSRRTQPRDFGVAAYELAIEQGGGQGFSQEFGRFAAATAEWNVPESDFPDEGELPRVKRDGSLRRGVRRKRFQLDHASYRLLRVKPRGRNRIRLKVRAPSGVRSAIALVGLEGAPASGIRVTEREYSARGGKLVVRLSGARNFERITAVVANADGRIAGFGGRDWAYRSDNERFRAALR